MLSQEAQVRKVPVGVIGAIVSFNYPLLLACWKIAPALASGNAIVLKPSEKTPLSVLRMASLFPSLDFPSGLLSVLVGDGMIGKSICESPLINKVFYS